MKSRVTSKQTKTKERKPQPEVYSALHPTLDGGYWSCADQYRGLNIEKVVLSAIHADTKTVKVAVYKLVEVREFDVAVTPKAK